jgi:amino acid transporter
VARENLGKYPGLIAGAALLIGYLMTAAVSLTAGVEAIASAFPQIWPYKVEVSLLILAIVTVLNLRGLRESSETMAIPVYLFLCTYLPMLTYGVIRLLLSGPQAVNIVELHPTQPISLFLVLHTFSAGCTALTGIEAISNGVPAFQVPEARNASRTLAVMTVLMAILFTGSIGLTQFLGVTAGYQETILSALAKKILGNNILYLGIQFSTLLILAVAANTSFAGFPRLTAILAQDGFLPRQLTNIGDRLVFSNGIVLLSTATGILIIIFQGNSHFLIPLFAVGVFLAFTFSQAGMVVHWWKEKQHGWQFKSLLNGLGALVTGITMVIIGVSKFLEGAWITVLLIPILIFIFLSIHTHYQDVRKELSLRGLPPSIKPKPTPRIIVPISGVHRGVIEAITFALTISKDVTAVYIELQPGNVDSLRTMWHRWWPDVPLVILPSPYRSIIQPLLDFLDETDRLHNDGQLAVVVLPEFVPAKWWQGLLHNQTTWRIKNALLYRRRNLGYQRVIIDVPYHLTK